MQMVIVPLLIGLLTQAAPLAPVVAAHDKLQSGAVTVAFAVTGKESTSYSYDLYFKKGSSYRIDWRDEKRRLIIVGRANGIFGYEPATNRYVYRQTADIESTVTELYRLFDAAEPLLSVYLMQKNGVGGFLSFFGDRVFESAKSATDLVFVSTKAPRLTLYADRATKLIKSFKLEGAAGLTAKWMVTKAPIGVDTALKFDLPRGARRVNAFSDEPAPAVIDGVETRSVVHRSRQAMGSLTTLVYTCDSYLFPGSGERKRSARAWWEHNGNFRYESDMDNPDANWRALFDGRKLTAWDRQQDKLFEESTSAKRIAGKLALIPISLDPLVMACLRDENLWDRIAAPGSHVRLVAEPAVLSGKKCRVVESKAADGWVTRAYVSESDGLILRIERRLLVEQKTVYSETILYNFLVVGLPIVGDAWNLEKPTDRAPEPFPGG